jgi:soluble lytic murein transglycosylase-like protein
MNWKGANDGPKWVPVIEQVETSLGISVDLLSRMAFEESSFLPARIDGTQASPAGALGILQLMPKFFPEVTAPIPFSDDSVRTQIIRAGQYVHSLYVRFGTWAEALAAYNFGPGNEKKYLAHRIAGLPTETQNYVTQILADVPMADSTGVPS